MGDPVLRADTAERYPSSNNSLRGHLTLLLPGILPPESDTAHRGVE